MKKFALLVLCMVLMTSNVFAYGEEKTPNNEMENSFVENQLSDSQKSDNNVDYVSLKNQLLSNGVEEKVAEELIQKLKRGEVWDVFKKEYQGLKPQEKRQDYQKTTYPDGSIKVVAFEEIEPQEDGGIQTRALIKKKGVKVWANAIYVNMSFKIDYIRDTSTGKAKITSQYAKNYNAGGGTLTEDTYGFLKGWHNPTNAWLACNFTGWQGLASGRYYIKLFVDGKGTEFDSNIVIK